MRARFTARVQQGEGASRRFFIQRVRVGHGFGPRAKTRQHRHLPRQGMTQRVDGVDAQPVGVGGERPALRRIARARRTRQPPRDVLVRRFIRRFGRHIASVSAAGQRRQHAAAHFCRGLAGEGDGDHFFRLRHAGEQGEVALDQQLGFARTRGRLHDERTRHIECASARSAVGVIRARGAIGALGTLREIGGNVRAHASSSDALRSISSRTRHKALRSQYSQVFGCSLGATSAWPAR